MMVRMGTVITVVETGGVRGRMMKRMTETMMVRKVKRVTVEMMGK